MIDHKIDTFTAELHEPKCETAFRTCSGVAVPRAEVHHGVMNLPAEFSRRLRRHEIVWRPADFDSIAEIFE